MNIKRTSLAQNKMGAMMSDKFSSPALAREMELIYGKESHVIQIQMKHEDEVKRYLAKTEKAYKKAAKSKLHFG
jgi:hypothetical protein